MNSKEGMTKFNNEEDHEEYFTNALMNYKIKEVVLGPDVLFIDFMNGNKMTIKSKGDGNLGIDYYAKDE